MPKPQLNLESPLKALLFKEILCEYRSRYAISALLAFSVITVTSISISLANHTLSIETESVLLWTVIFFSAMAGLGRVYSTEKDNCTLDTLIIYCSPYTIVWGKTIFNIALLTATACLIIPLFIIFFSLEVGDWRLFFVTVLLGAAGMAVVSTLMSCLTVEAKGGHTLFTVISFPILMPLLLNVIDLTAKNLYGIPASLDQYIVLAGFNAVAVAVIILVIDWL